MGIQGCLISQMNFDYKEYDGKKRFSRKSKALILCTQWGEHDYIANNKKNRDYYKYPSLPHFYG